MHLRHLLPTPPPHEHKAQKLMLEYGEHVVACGLPTVWRLAQFIHPHCAYSLPASRPVARHPV